jgi:hypothetical protein
MSHAEVSAAAPRGGTGDGVGRVTCHTRQNGVDLACDMSHAESGPTSGAQARSRALSHLTSEQYRVDRETPQDAATRVLMGDILFDVQVLHARGAHEVGNPCERRAPDHERFPGKVVSEPARQCPDQAVVPHPRFPRRVWPRLGPKFK